MIKVEYTAKEIDDLIKYVDSLAEAVLSLDDTLDCVIIAGIFKYSFNGFEEFLKEILEDNDYQVDPDQLSILRLKLAPFQADFNRYREMYYSLF